MTMSQHGSGESSLVFNHVWTGRVFSHLQYLVASQIEHSSARFRFLLNACPPDQIELMERFAARHRGRIVEIADLTTPTMIRQGDMARHGDILDAVLAGRDDGPHFAFIDTDIMARRSFVPDFLAVLGGGADAVTSGRGVWSDSDVLPPGHLGVNGEYFRTAKGFLFGSPHFAIYDRAVLEETCRRWQIGFGTGASPSEVATQRLDEAGLTFWLYDTGKLVNTFLQLDGGHLEHVEHAALTHLGGMSHYLSPPAYIEAEDGTSEPDWAAWDGMEARFAAARFCAHVLESAAAGVDAPGVPERIGDDLARRLAEIRDDLVDLVTRHRRGAEADMPSG